MPVQSYKCGVCEKTRAQNRFSQTTIRNYEQSKQRATRAKNPSLIKYPRCSDCSGAPTHELQCAGCGVVRSLDQFSRNMRRNPDNALCHDCSQERQDIEPDHRDQIQEEITIDRIRAGAPLSALGTGSTAFAHSANSRATTLSNNFTSGSSMNGGSDWINPPIPIPDDPRACSSNGKPSPSVVSNNTQFSNNSRVIGTGWDTAAWRDQAAASHRSSSSTVSRGSRGGGGNPGFVKQNAVRPDPVMRAQLSLARQQRREADQAEQATLRDSDDDDDSDDSEPAY